jgi:uncharacterized integral membrane protein (TIGR00698 family)
MLVVIVSVFLTDLINQASGIKGMISYITVAILMGMLLANTVGVPALCKPGIRLCLAKLLRLGIILMGIRLTFFDAVKIGLWGLPIVILCIVAALFITSYITRWLKLPERLGTLIAVGTAICGNSAIVATAPCIEAKDEEVTYAVANVTLFGVLAMFVYPYISHFLFGGNPVMAGLFEGTSIHDTSQVTAAGLIFDQVYGITRDVYSATAADVAIVTKLVRNTAMAIVIPVMVLLYARRMAAQPECNAKPVNAIKLLPLFVVGFIVMAIIRSIGDASILGGGLAWGWWDQGTWSALERDISTWATYILATAMAGVGLGTSLSTIKGIGLKPFAVGLGAAFTVGIISTVLVWSFGTQVAFQ